VKSILFLCSEEFPTPYRFLDQVFNKIILAQGIKTSWVMYSAQPCTFDPVTWNGNCLVTIPKVRSTGPLGLFVQYTKTIRQVLRAIKVLTNSSGTFDLVQVRDDPFMALIGWIYAKRNGLPFVFQLSHLKAEECVFGWVHKVPGYSIAGLLKAGIDLVVRQLVLHQANKVFFISDEMRQLFLSKRRFRGFEPKFIGVEEGVQVVTEPALGKTTQVGGSPRTQLGLDDKTLFLYVGTLTRLRGLEVLIEGFAAAVADDHTMHLVIVGTGPRPEDLTFLKSLAVKLGIMDRLTFTGRLQPDAVDEWLAVCDIGVSAIPDNPIYKYSSPIKILEYMVFGKPVLASNLLPQEKLITASKGGLVVTHSLEGYANGFNSMKKLSVPERNRMGALGKAYVVKHRSFNVMANQILAAYQDCWRKVGTSVLSTKFR